MSPPRPVLAPWPRDATSRVLGLMAGTSADGIDAVVASCPPPHAAEWPRVLAHAAMPFDAALRARVLDAAHDRAGARELAILHHDLGETFARAAVAAREAADVALDAIGCAGVTVAHVPPSEDGFGGTLCLGDGDVVAERTGCLVVGDLRARDRAAGGHGAPLVPYADVRLLRRPGRTRAALNLGGIANVTIVPPRGEPLAFDTGPGNMLLDGAVRRATGGREAFDRDGARARAGTVDGAWLATLIDEDAFLREPPPRSTGRERYGDAWLERHAAAIDARALPDVLATLCAYTVRAVRDALRDEALRAVPWERAEAEATRDQSLGGPVQAAPLAAPDELVVSGGGVRNAALLEELRAALEPECAVRSSTEALGVAPEAKEALAFALLADATLRGLPSSYPRVTGARRPSVLGKLSPP